MFELVVVAECDHRQKISITFGIQKDFIYLLANSKSTKKGRKRGMVKRTKCYAYILYNSVCQKEHNEKIKKTGNRRLAFRPIDVRNPKLNHIALK